MRLNQSHLRWVMKGPALALVALAAIAGATGSVRAISPTMSAPIQWRGGVEIALFAITNRRIYAVPGNANFMLTDLVLSNGSSSSPVAVFVFTGTSSTCDLGTAVPRTSNIRVPPNDTVTVSLTTGIGFLAGQSVCINTTQGVDLTARGFLFAPAPAG